MLTSIFFYAIDDDMFRVQKKQFAVFLFTVFIAAAIFLQGVLHVEQGTLPIDFVFIFIASIVLYPLIIIGERPRLSRPVSSHHLRAPPLN